MISDLQQQLGIDASFLPQFLIFIFLFLWMKIVFFGPFLTLLEKRETQSDGLSEESAKLEEEAANRSPQGDLFSTAAKKDALSASHPAIEALQQADLDSMSPKEALDLLYRLKKLSD